MNTYWNDGTELFHYGILGMRWGVRRFQNPDGTLTEEGRERYQKMYNKRVTKAITTVNDSSRSRYVKAYNKAADDMNNGGIERFNANWNGKRHGTEYENAYLKEFDKLVSKYLRELVREDLLNNSDYIKAEKIADEIDRRYGKTVINRLKYDF